MTSGSSDITPTHTIPTQSAAVKLIKNLKINNATHRHFYFLSAPEGTSKNQNSQHPAAKRSTSPNNLVQISCTGKTQTFFIFQKTFLNQMINESNNYQLGLQRFPLQAKTQTIFHISENINGLTFSSSFHIIINKVDADFSLKLS